MYLNNQENPCDLLILDVEEQLFDSALIAKPVKQIRPDLPLVLLQAPGKKANEDLLALYNSCLAKPVNPEQLLYALSTAIGSM